MGKNTNKKGKQKEASAIGGPAPPPPRAPPQPHPDGAASITKVPSPPAAKHIRHLPITIDTIEEEDAHAGPSGASIYGENSWEDLGQRGDVTDAGDWAPAPGNGNDWGPNDVGWETNPLPQIQELPSSPPPLPPPPPPPPPPAPPLVQSQQQKNPGGNSWAQVKQQQQQRAQPQQHQHQPQRRQNAITPAMGRPAWNHQDGMNKTGWNTSKNHHTKDGWNNWAAESGLAAQTDWQDQEDDFDEDGWNDATPNSWAQQGSGWGHAASVQSAQNHATPRHHQGGWQNWGAEAQRLPKVTFDPAIPPSPSTAGNRLALSQPQQSQILNSLLNRSQQNHQPLPNPPNQGGIYPPAATPGWNQVPQKRPPQNVQQHVQQHFPEHVQQQAFYHDPQQPIHGAQQSFHHGAQHGHHNGNNNNNNKQQSKKQKKHQQDPNDVWGLGEGWSDLHEDENGAMHDAWAQKPQFPLPSNGISGVPTPALAPVDPFSIHASPKNKLGLSVYTNDAQMSKTLSYAYQGSGSSPGGGTGRMAMKMLADVHFIESQGNALNSARNAFYNTSRKASDRFHWLFPAEKDDRVANLMDWIDTLTFAIASFGLQKFLHTRERGALVINADYAPPQAPDDYALDWMTWDQIQPTMDRTLQVSVGYYNPTTHVIVIVYLPSPSGNSVAIWRRKLAIPDNIRLSHQAQMTQVMSSLHKPYIVHVEELPSLKTEDKPSQKKKKKRKWYKLWLST